MVNKDLFGRLLNWKFKSALNYLDGATDEEKSLVEALARMFGNCGWFDGDMAEIVCHALLHIGISDPNDEGGEEDGKDKGQ
jgi:uncharacterized protein (DUF1810 family)